MNRRGELSLRGSMRDSTQVVDFRSKLIASGFFANVAVEEQTPTPDRQKVNVRISGQWKPAAARGGLAIGPTAEEIEKSKTRVRDAPGGVFPGMDGFPGIGGLPAGLGMPMGRPSPSTRKAAPPPPGAGVVPGMPIVPGMPVPPGMPAGQPPANAPKSASPPGPPPVPPTFEGNP